MTGGEERRHARDSCPLGGQPRAVGIMWKRSGGSKQRRKLFHVEQCRRGWPQRSEIVSLWAWHRLGDRRRREVVLLKDD